MQETVDVSGYEAAIFDVDGTLVDNMGVHLEIWIELLRDMGVEMTAPAFVARYAGQTNPAILKGIFGDGMGAGEIAGISERKEALYRERYAPIARAVPGLDDLIGAFERTGRPCAVASSGSPVNVNFVLDLLGWRRRFRAVVTGEDVTHSKPHPEAFLTAARRMGVAPGACVVFEDAPIGIEAARRAGMSCVAVATTVRREELSRLPGLLAAVDDFRSVTASM